MANSNGSPLSIIDGYIQILQRKLKDLSLEKSYVTASIQALQALWDDISSEYTRKNVPTTVLCKPVATRDLLYRKDLMRKNVHQDTFCEVIQLSAEGINFNVLIVVEEERSRYIFRPLEEIDTTSRVRPFDKISYFAKKIGNKEGKKMAGFLYPRFEMLKEYHAKTHIADFPKIIKGLVVGLTNLEKKIEMGKMDKYIIKHNLCIVQDGKIGSMIFLSCPAEIELEQERRWLDDYQSLKNYLSEIFDISRVPYGFNIVLQCMGLARSKGRRLRLLKSPYFLSVKDKVIKFISMMNAIVWTCGPVRKKLQQEKGFHRWHSKVYRKCGDEVDNVLDGTSYGTDGPSFLQFLFNCVKHLKSDCVLKKCKKIMEIIGKVDEGFLDYVFWLTYECKWKTIPMLDLN